MYCSAFACSVNLSVDANPSLLTLSRHRRAKIAKLHKSNSRWFLHLGLRTKVTVAVQTAVALNFWGWRLGGRT
jgi:hypothetical protein